MYKAGKKVLAWLMTVMIALSGVMTGIGSAAAGVTAPTAVFADNGSEGQFEIEITVSPRSTVTLIEYLESPAAGNEGASFEGYYNEMMGNYETTGDFSIKDRAGLAAISKMVNVGEKDFSGKTVTLTQSIDLGGSGLVENRVQEDDSYKLSITGDIINVWTPIGDNNAYRFSGTFDGAGFTISQMISVAISDGLPVFTGLFGWVGKYGRIRNVTIDEESYMVTLSTSSYNYTGGIAGRCEGEIRNCVNRGAVVISSPEGSTRAGGIVGECSSAINDCENSGAILASSNSGTSLAGGIAGECGGAISKCKNSGEVIASSDSLSESISFSQAGGIVGKGKSDISNCENTGEVAAFASSSFAEAGGIAAGCEGAVSDCENGGSIISYSVSDTPAAGGIVGNGKSDIRDCKNRGDVAAVSVSSYLSYAGGIAGQCGGAVSACENSGVVTADTNSGVSYAGGIAGICKGDIRDCENSGSVASVAASSAYIGGLAGRCYGVISGCENSAPVTSYTSATSSYSFAGGIVGSGDSDVIDCKNKGSVTTYSSTSYAEGIAGSCKGTVIDCENSGIVSKNEQTSAGEAGQTANATPRFTDVQTGAWYYEDVEFVAQKGLLNGTGPSQFSPDTTLSRGMIVTVLGRLADVAPAMYAGASFADVSESQYYAPYVKWWTDEIGIPEGISDQQFFPDEAITRQEFTVMLNKFSEYMGHTLPRKNARADFADEGKIDSYALEHVYAMQQAGVINGKDGNVMDPMASITRAEFSAMLHRFITVTIGLSESQG